MASIAAHFPAQAHAQSGQTSPFSATELAPEDLTEADSADGFAETVEAKSTPESVPESEPDQGLHWRGSLDLFSSVLGIWRASGQLNPDNQVLRTPHGVVDNQLRPNLRFELDRLQVVVRPRFSLDWSVRRDEDAWSDEWKGSVDLPEAYASWRVNDVFSLSYGLQNYQWGPAETLNATNTIIHRPYNRNLLTLVKGKQIVRLNISYGRRFSTILLFEPGDNGEPPFRFNTRFDRKILLRTELTSRSGASYVGLAGGAGSLSAEWFGEYGSVALSDAFSIYIDARHQAGSDAWYPTASADDPVGFEQRRSQHIKTIGVAGARYTFESGADLRVEYIHNDVGYTRQEERLATQNVLTRLATTPAVLGYLQAPGLDLPGQKYAYASARAPDLLKDKSLTMDLRVIKNFADNTGIVFVNIEWFATDALVVFSSSSIAFGREDGDLTRQARAYSILGIRHTW